MSETLSPTDDSKPIWQEYKTEEGRPYYFNRLTGLSVWEKPPEMKVSEAPALSSPWKEYTADNGRKYYYNSITKESTWSEPEEHKRMRENDSEDKKRGDGEVVEVQQASVGSEALANSSKSGGGEGIKRDEPVYQTQEERVEAFRSLLVQAGVTSTWTWDMTMRAIINDERYKALPTLAGKKQVLAEFQGQKRKEEREEKRKKENKIREVFVQMLRECEHLKPGMTWRKAAPYFEGDSRNKLVPDREKEEIFEEFMIDRDRQQKEAARQVRKDNMRKFREKLQSDKGITVASQWRKIKDQFKDDELFKNLDKMDRLTVFEDYIRDLEREEEEKKRIDLAGRKRASRISRENFRVLLNEKYQLGILHLNVKWKDFVAQIKEDARYKEMVAPQQLGSLPSELFSDFMEELEERFYKDKKKVKEIAKESGFTITPKTTFEELMSVLKAHPKFETISDKNYHLLHNELVSKVEREEKKVSKDAERKQRKLFDKFSDLLEGSKTITSFSKWEDERPRLEHHSAFQKMPSEEDRIRVFNEFIARKKQEDSSDEEGRIRDSPDKGGEHKQPASEESDRSKKEKKEKRSKKEKRDKRDKRDRDRDRRSDKKEKKDKKRKRHSSPDDSRKKRRGGSDSEDGEMKM